MDALGPWLLADRPLDAPLERVREVSHGADRRAIVETHAIEPPTIAWSILLV